MRDETATFVGSWLFCACFHPIVYAILTKYEYTRNYTISSVRNFAFAEG